MILKAQSPTQLDNDPTSMNTGHKKTVPLDLCTNCANKHAYNKYAHSIAVAVFFFVYVITKSRRSSGISFV